MEAFYEMTEMALYRANDPVNNGFTWIDLTELYYFLRNNTALLKKKFALGNLLEETEALLLSYAANSIQKGRIDPYTGGFLQAHYFVEEGICGTYLFSLIDDIFSGRIDILQKTPEQDSGYTGITHGLAFYLLFLVRCYEKGINTGKSLQLIKQLSERIRNEEQDVELYGSYFNDRTGARGRSRLNLCYGDAGIVYAILRSQKYNSGVYTEDKSLQMISVVAGRRNAADTGITGNDILYGNSGMLFYFCHLQQARLVTANLVADAIRFWNEKHMHNLYAPDYGDMVPSATANSWREKQQLSLLEGETGACYLHMCHLQSELADKYIRTITYMC